MAIISIAFGRSVPWNWPVFTNPVHLDEKPAPWTSDQLPIKLRLPISAISPTHISLGVFGSPEMPAKRPNFVPASLPPRSSNLNHILRPLVPGDRACPQ